MELRRQRSQSAAMHGRSGPPSSQTTGAASSMPPPQVPLERGKTESAGSLSVNTEIAYSPQQSMVSNTPMSARSTSDVRSPPGGNYPSQPRPESLTITTTVVRPPMLPASFSSSAETIYHSAQSNLHPPQLPPQWHHQQATQSQSVMTSGPQNGMAYTNGAVDQQQPGGYQQQSHYQQQSQQHNGMQVQYGEGMSGSVSSPDLATQLLLQSVPSDPSVEGE